MEVKHYEVTIGIPVYGVENYIRKAFESALSQTFSNIEYIIVDDCGNDKSIDIIKEIRQSHPRKNDIKIIVQPYNKGCSAARNLVFEQAEGKYVYFMDSDDYISPDCIEVLYKMAELYNAEATFGSIKKIDKRGNTLYLKYNFRVFDKENEFVTFANIDFHDNISNYIWNILLRLDFVRNNNLKFPDTKFGEDVLFNNSLQPKITRAVLVPNITYTYIMRDFSLSSYEIKDIIDIEVVKPHFNNCRLLKKQIMLQRGKPFFDRMCAREMMHIFYTVVGLLKNKNKIVPPISYGQICRLMLHPVSLNEILRFQHRKMENFLFYLMGILPTCLSRLLIVIVAKLKRLM